jgi:hypothetical protein
MILPKYFDEDYLNKPANQWAQKIHKILMDFLTNMPKFEKLHQYKTYTGTPPACRALTISWPKPAKKLQQKYQWQTEMLLFSTQIEPLCPSTMGPLNFDNMDIISTKIIPRHDGQLLPIPRTPNQFSR